MIHVAHDGAKAGDVIGSRLYADVNTVQQGNKAHSLFREVPLHVMPGHDVVATQLTEVFRNDYVDPFGLGIGNHPLKVRAVKAGAAPAVVDAGIMHGQSVPLHELVQQRTLVGNAFGWALVLILL